MSKSSKGLDEDFSKELEKISKELPQSDPNTRMRKGEDITASDFLKFIVEVNNVKDRVDLRCESRAASQPRRSSP